MSKTKLEFTKVSMIQIPENYLLDRVVKELNGREMFVDTDQELEEKIYSGDVFEAILGELSELDIELPKKVIKQLEELAELIDSEYVQITKI